MKKILLFNCPPILKMLFMMFNYELIEVKADDYGQQLGYLLNLPNYNRQATITKAFNESLMVFYNLSDDDLDMVLAILKNNQIKIDLKAIVTEYNINWTAKSLYIELNKEKVALK